MELCTDLLLDNHVAMVRKGSRFVIIDKLATGAAEVGGAGGHKKPVRSVTGSKEKELTDDGDVGRVGDPVAGDDRECAGGEAQQAARGLHQLGSLLGRDVFKQAVKPLATEVDAQVFLRLPTGGLLKSERLRGS